MSRTWTRWTCLALLGSVYGCGAARLDDAEWKRRTTQLAEQNSPSVEARSAPGLNPAEEPPAVLASTRVRFIIERGPKGGAKKRWDVTLDGPVQRKKKGGANCTVQFNLTTEDGTSVNERRRAYGYPGTLTVSIDGESPESGDALIPIGLMQIGLVEACGLASNSPDEEDLTDSQRLLFAKRYMSHLCPLLAMTQMVNQSAAVK